MDKKEKKKEEVEQEKIPVLRTFKTDASEFIRKENVSMADVVLAQANKKIPSGLEKEEYKKRIIFKRIAVIFIILTIILGISASVFYYKKNKEKDIKVELKFPKSIVLTEKEKVIDLINLKKEIKNVLYYDNLFAGEMLDVHIIKDSGGIKEKIDIKEFFTTLEIKTPIGLFEVLEDKFMYAVFNGFQNKPVLILKLKPNLKAYENAFAAMLRWEKTIGEEFEEYFDYKGARYNESIFYDIEIKNNDIRVLNDENNKSLIMYSFINRKYLVITTDDNTLKETLHRLSSVQYLND